MSKIDRFWLAVMVCSTCVLLYTVYNNADTRARLDMVKILLSKCESNSSEDDVQVLFHARASHD